VTLTARKPALPRPGHRRALALSGGVIFAICNRLGLDDATRLRLGAAVFDNLYQSSQ